MSLIKVIHITLESYNQLIEAGYTVKFTGNTKKSPYANYQYKHYQEPVKSINQLLSHSKASNSHKIEHDCCTNKGMGCNCRKGNI